MLHAVVVVGHDGVVSYRADWLAWVDRCVAEDQRTVQVVPGEDGSLRGYVFVLPERLAFVWDAAVLNELYVVPDRRGTGVADDLMDAAAYKHMIGADA